MNSELTPNPPIRGPSAYAGVTDQIAVGRYALEIGYLRGALVHEASRAERAHVRPRATPILLRPRLIRGLLDRQTELASALSALDAGLPIEVSGEPGIGKTAVLRHLAHHPRAAAFVDGTIYVPAQHQSPSDLQQLIFEAFHESDEFSKPTEAEIRRGLQEKQALILLDDVHLTQAELEQVLDIAPRSAFVVATRERCLWGEVRSLALKGLPADDAVLLLEREIEHSLEGAERSAAADLCVAIEGHPLRILQAAAIIRERGLSPDGWAATITPEILVTELMATTDEKQRRALLALTALPGVPLQAQHVAGIAEITDIEPSLLTLVHRGLLVCSHSRYQLADGVADRLRRTEDPKPWVNRGITYFTAWAERHRRHPDSLLEESEALLRAQQHAVDNRRWGEVLTLGWLLEEALVVRARWGAWKTNLERCLAAAKAFGDRSAEAWALHQIGTRAVCLGESGVARASLSQAMKLREALGDEAAASASRQNLRFVLPPVSDPTERPRTSSTEPMATVVTDEGAGHSHALPMSNSVSTQSRKGAAPLRQDRANHVLDFDSVPLRPETQPPVRTTKASPVGAVFVTLLLLAIVGGFAYWDRPGELASRSWNLAAVASFVENGLRGALARTARTPPTRRAAAEPREPRLVQSTEVVLDSESDALVSDRPPGANILIFTPRPGSFTRGGPTNLCYAVSDALQVRLEPGIGELNPTRTLSCIRVAPRRTTTYELTAVGRDGEQVSQQLVIVVR